MEYEQLEFDLRHAPSVKLFRRLNAPLIVAFLFAQFKKVQRLSAPFEDIIVQLERFLETLNERQPRSYESSATTYLKQWADEDHQLVRIVTRGSDVFVELTADSERVIGWIEGLYRHEFVGTESRFLAIFSLLEEIIAKSTEDVPTRLAQLEKQRDTLQLEIDLIREAGRVEPFTETQIKERFLRAGEVARDLVRDFAAVEQQFRLIAKTLQEQQVQPGIRKGALVGSVLDADTTLHESDQGRSFYAFWEFLMSPSKQDQLSEMLEQVYALPALRDLALEHPRLRRMTRSLIEAGDKIVRSNHRLAEQLRRLLDERVQAERRRVRELILEIKHAALRQVYDPPDGIFLELEGLPEINLVMEKSLWEARAAPRIQQRPPNETFDVNLADFSPLFDQFYIDEERLRERVGKLLETERSFTLLQMLEHFPLEQGLAEVIAYMALATREEQHDISESDHETIVLNQNVTTQHLEEYSSDGLRSLRIPKITFRRAEILGEGREF